MVSYLVALCLCQVWWSITQLQHNSLHVCTPAWAHACAHTQTHTQRLCSSHICHQHSCALGRSPWICIVACCQERGRNCHQSYPREVGLLIPMHRNFSPELSLAFENLQLPCCSRLSAPLGTASRHHDVLRAAVLLSARETCSFAVRFSSWCCLLLKISRNANGDLRNSI